MVLHIYATVPEGCSVFSCHIQELSDLERQARAARRCSGCWEVEPRSRKQAKGRCSVYSTLITLLILMFVHGLCTVNETSVVGIFRSGKDLARLFFRQRAISGVARVDLGGVK